MHGPVTGMPPPQITSSAMAIPDRPNTNEMERNCVDRHNAFVNVLFCDWSARKVGLKELWTLKWHRTFNIAGPWTRAGGVQVDNWPMWMRHYTDY